MTPNFAKAIAEDLSNAVPVYPCDTCPCNPSDLCYTCQLPFAHIRVKPECTFCDAPVTRGIVTPYRIEGEFGMTFTGHDTIPVCDSPDCQALAEQEKEIV